MNQKDLSTIEITKIEYEQLLRYKDVAMEKKSIAAKNGKAWERYQKLLQLEKWLKERHSLIYKSYQSDVQKGGNNGI